MGLRNWTTPQAVLRHFRCCAQSRLRDSVELELGRNKVGPARQIISRFAYELRMRSDYFVPQADANIVGPLRQAQVMGDRVTLAPVLLYGRKVVAVLNGDLPDGAGGGEAFRVGVVGRMGDGSADFYEKAIGMRPAVGLEVVQKPGRIEAVGAPTFVRGRGDLRFSPLPTTVFREVDPYDPDALRQWFRY